MPSWGSAFPGQWEPRRRAPTLSTMEELGRFTLTPMSAGDIIDSAVRLYRSHFLVLLRIVLAPSLVSYVGGIVYTLGIRNFSLERGDARAVATGMMIAGGLLLYVTGKIVFLAFVGGTSRALVSHFAFGATLRAREVFRAVRMRWWQLVGATFAVFFLLLGVFMVVYMIFSFALVLYLALAAFLLTNLPSWMQVVLHSIVGLASVVGLLLLGLLVYSRIIFVPQALMVEGKGVFSAIGRSILLAGGDIRKIGSILLFQIYIAWSLLVLLVLPLGWYAYLNGIDINPFNDSAPIWYNIAQQTVTEISEILLAPIAMVAFTLLYLDVRVRKEGFDVELLANRYLATANPLLRHAPPAFEPPPAPIDSIANESLPNETVTDKAILEGSEEIRA
jgi:hypothetical protein